MRSMLRYIEIKSSDVTSGAFGGAVADALAM
jgi:hypothetical protein